MNGGPRSRELFRLAWPSALTLMLQNAYRLNDLYWVGELGGAAGRVGQAAVGVAGMVTILTLAFYEGLAAGVLAMSARAHGQGHAYRARRVLRLALWVSLLLAAVVAATGLTTMRFLVDWLIADGPGQAELAAYLGPIFLGGIFLCLAPVTSRAFLAMKDTRTPLCLELGAVALNTSLNAVLVPSLGVAGAAWATVASRAATSLVGLWLLHRRLPQLGEPDPRPPSELLRTIARIGAPVTAAVAVYSIAYQLVLGTTFTAFGAELGPTARAALACGFTIEGLAFCLVWGIAQATGSLVGNELGAGRPEDAAAVMARSTRASLLFTGPMMLLFLFAPGPLASILTEDPLVHAETVVYLRILAWSQLALALQGIWDVSLSSAGHTLPVFWSTTFWNLSRVPLCWWLAIDLGYGLPGVWWAVNLSTYGKALTSGWVVHRGRWKHARV